MRLTLLAGTPGSICLQPVLSECASIHPPALDWLSLTRVTHHSCLQPLKSLGFPAPSNSCRVGVILAGFKLHTVH